MSFHFPKSEKQIREEVEVKRQIAELKGETSDEEKSTAYRTYDKKNNTLRNILILIFVIIAIFIILFFLMKGKGVKGNTSKPNKKERDNIHNRIKQERSKAMSNYPGMPVYVNNIPKNNYRNVNAVNYNNVVRQQPIMKSNDVFNRLKQIKSL